MDTTKLQEAITELQHHRDVIDAALAGMRSALALLGNVQAVSSATTPDRSSYITDTVAILEEAGKPLHMSEIMTRIIARHGGDEIKRNSVEASINRHITKGKGRARLARVAPSTYAVAGLRHAAPLLINQVA